MSRNLEFIVRICETRGTGVQLLELQYEYNVVRVYREQHTTCDGSVNPTEVLRDRRT